MSKGIEGEGIEEDEENRTSYGERVRVRKGQGRERGEEKGPDQMEKQYRGWVVRGG